MPGEPRQGNGMAVTSLVMGLLLCIPLITGLGGIIFGAVGIKKTKDPRVGGKGLAIAGLVLGIVNILLWTLAGGAIWAGISAMISGTATQREIARTFIKDLSEGKVDAAAAACDPTMPRASLEKASQTMKSWGALKDTTTLGFNANAGTGTLPQIIVSGSAEFANTTKSFVITMHKQNEQWKIIKFDFQ
jgi:hypothetical protein